MTLLHNKQLSQMRRQVLSMLPDVAAIQSKTVVADSAGGWTETWTTVATYSCRLDPIETTVRDLELFGNAQVLQSLYQLTLPYDADLDYSHRVVIDNVAYDVLRINVNHSNNVSKRAIVSKIDEDSA